MQPTAPRRMSPDSTYIVYYIYIYKRYIYTNSYVCHIKYKILSSTSKFSDSNMCKTLCKKSSKIVFGAGAPSKNYYRQLEINISYCFVKLNFLHKRVHNTHLLLKSYMRSWKRNASASRDEWNVHRTYTSIASS